MRVKHGLPIEAHIAVFSGYAPYDAELLGLAFLDLIRRDARAYLLVTGNSPPQLLNVLQRTPIAGRITIAGVVGYHQLGEFLACGDVMLLPYTDRGVNRGRYPGKIGDYLAAGKPVITNPTGDLAELVRREQVGVLVEETPQAIAEAALMLFNNPNERQRLGQNARRVAEDKLDWRLLTAELEQFYLAML
jgi:glycosyltransferase involved in cell wall biosynthesis